MGTGRTLNKTSRTRPSKSGSEKARRQREHRKRLIALGANEADVNKMDAPTIRRLLARPKKTAALYAKA